MAKRVLQIINQPRQFVAIRDDFGPDRHRHSESESEIETERRYASENDATIVYSLDKKVRPKLSSPNKVIFHLAELAVVSEWLSRILVNFG